jgi:DNA-binding NarL/FixJ family response regulator
VVCKVSRCINDVKARGMCRKHYDAWLKKATKEDLAESTEKAREAAERTARLVKGLKNGEVKAMFAKGMKITDVARSYSVSTFTVHKYMGRVDKSKWTPDAEPPDGLLDSFSEAKRIALCRPWGSAR